MTNPLPIATTHMQHICCIEHWSRADRGPRGIELRAAAKFIADEHERLEAANERILELERAIQQALPFCMVPAMEALTAVMGHPAQALRQQPEVTCEGQTQRALAEACEQAYDAENNELHVEGSPKRSWGSFQAGWIAAARMKAAQQSTLVEAPQQPRQEAAEASRPNDPKD